MKKDLSKTDPQNGESHLDPKDDQEAIQHIDESPMERDTDKTPEKNVKSTLDMDISKTVQQNQKSLQFMDLSKTEQQGEENPLDTSSDDEVKSTKTLIKMHSKEDLTDERPDIDIGLKPLHTALVTQSVKTSKVNNYNTLEKTESREDLPDGRLDSGNGHRPSHTPSGLFDITIKPNIESNDKLPNDCRTPAFFAKHLLLPVPYSPNVLSQETTDSNKELQYSGYDKKPVPSPSDLLPICIKPFKVKCADTLETTDGQEDLSDELQDCSSGQTQSPTLSALFTKSVKPLKIKVKCAETQKTSDSKEHLPDELLDSSTRQSPTPTPSDLSSRLKPSKKEEKCVKHWRKPTARNICLMNCQILVVRKHHRLLPVLYLSKVLSHPK